MSRTFAALAHPNYRWFISGQAVTNIGTWMQRVAQDWLVLEVTHGDAVALGLVTALQFLPFIVLAPVAGVVADRVSPRKVLAVTGSLGAVAAGSLAAATIAGAAGIGLIFVAGAVLGVAAAFDQPARQALVGRLVPRSSLANAVALNSATFNLARIIGPALAGLAIAAVGSGPVFAVNSASFLVAVGTLAFVRPAAVEHGPGDAADRVTLRAGIAYLRSRPDLLVVLAAVGLAAIFAFNYSITIALMATAEFHRGAAEFGLLGAALSLGSITGSLLSARRQGPVGLRFVLVAGVAFGAVTAVSGLMPNYVWFALALPFCGLAALTFSVAAQSYLQLHTAPELRGRVMGVYVLVFFGSNPVGAPLLGWISMQFGPRWGLIGGGVLAAVGLLVLAWFVARRGIARPAAASGVAERSHEPVPVH
ncbi:MAG: hypothetical protein QG597_547 [Actinomycetota bacterium]|nr:hypothetical protein [Actinomycetota bacterium]